MRLGPRALALFLVSVLPSCGKVKPAPVTCPIAVADGGATKPDAAAGDGGNEGDGGLDGGQSDSGAGGDLCTACGADHGARGSCGRAIRVELSGASSIAASVRHPEALYVPGRPGDQPQFFAVEPSGVDRGVYRLEGANNIDWEDIAVGPCPGGSCVYIADMGDDPQIRTDYVIYRVLEPFSLSAGDHAVPFEALRFAYPDGKSHDAQTLLLHPVTGLLTIVTKDHSGSGLAVVYEFPTTQPSVTATTQLLRRGQFSPPPPPLPPTDQRTVIDGDVHPQTLAVLLRTPTDFYFYAMQPEQSVANALGGTPCSLRVAEEDELGKAVGWLRSGSGYVTVGEGPPSDLNVVVCGAN
jgi:hypothetical protein